jgi:hypothetical protein
METKWSPGQKKAVLQDMGKASELSANPADLGGIIGRPWYMQLSPVDCDTEAMNRVTSFAKAEIRNYILELSSTLPNPLWFGGFLGSLHVQILRNLSKIQNDEECNQRSCVIAIDTHGDVNGDFDVIHPTTLKTERWDAQEFLHRSKIDSLASKFPDIDIHLVFAQCNGKPFAAKLLTLLTVPSNLHIYGLAQECTHTYVASTAKWTMGGKAVHSNLLNWMKYKTGSCVP